MPRYIMKLTDEKEKKDYYLEWSTIVDAPVTFGMELGEFREYCRHEYGQNGLRDFDERIARANEKGISAYPPFDDMNSYFRYNRAGGNETTLTKEQIIEKYCIQRTA